MDSELLAERFEADRTRLQAVAYRLLGAASEADDAVQEPGCGGAVPTPAK
jgi:DNA-directed RNA polymerase specialized sigma24 family protein